ncbi:MAG TPA: MFS transporter [Pirellulales bacterium]|nr:MFS transporter [Pirellulales bacterium]
MADGAAFSLMVGAGETYLPAFVLAAGLGELAAGLITTVPLLAGGLLQLVSPWAIRRLGSHRRWVVLCAFCQALSFLPLALGAWLGTVPAALVFLMASIYWGAGLAAGPAWSTWVGTLVPERVRPTYFARRTRISQAGVMIGFVAAGVSLQFGASTGHVTAVFAAIFSAAAACRLVSTLFVASQSEPVPPSGDHRDVPLRELIGRLRHGADGSLLIYLLSVQCAAQIAGPYFTPYMLKQVRFSYLQYVVLIGVSFAAKVVALPALGRLARRVGARQLLWLGGVGIVPVSAMWLVSNTFAWLLVVQILAGVTWAAYELAMFLLFFESIPASERTSVLTTYNFGHALATVLGSLVGGALLAALGKSPAVYLAIFGLSSIARLATIILLSRVPASDVRSIAVVGRRILGIRPAVGSIDRPIFVPEGGREPSPGGEPAERAAPLPGPVLGFDRPQHQPLPSAAAAVTAATRLNDPAYEPA